MIFSFLLNFTSLLKLLFLSTLVEMGVPCNLSISLMVISLSFSGAQYQTLLLLLENEILFLPLRYSLSPPTISLPLRCFFILPLRYLEYFYFPHFLPLIPRASGMLSFCMPCPQHIGFAEIAQHFSSRSY